MGVGFYCFFSFLRTGQRQKVQEDDANDDDGTDGQNGAHGAAYDAHDQSEGDQGVAVEQTRAADESGAADEGQEERRIG